MAQKKYNDPVIYAHNVKENGVLVSKDSNALVIASMVQDGKETLQLLYLDAAFDRSILSGADVQSAIKIVYASPYVENAFSGDEPKPGRPRFAPISPAQGWKEVENPDKSFVEAIMPHLIDLSHAVAMADPKADISPDGTLRNAAKIILSIPEIETNAADAQAKNDAAWEKQLQAANAEADKLRGELNALNQQKLELLKQAAKPPVPPVPPVLPAPPVPPATEEPKK